MQLSADKTILAGGGQRENRQEFETVPTLMEFQYFSRVICRELTTYKIWPVSFRYDTTTRRCGLMMTPNRRIVISSAHSFKISLARRAMVNLYKEGCLIQILLLNVASVSKIKSDCSIIYPNHSRSVRSLPSTDLTLTYLRQSAIGAH